MLVLLRKVLWLIYPGKPFFSREENPVSNLSLEYLSKRRSKTKRKIALVSKDSALVQESEDNQERMIQSDDLQMGDGSLYIQFHHVNCDIQVLPLNRVELVF